MDLEAEEQNKLPSLKLGKEAGTEPAVSRLPSFSFLLLPVFMNCLPRTISYARHSHPSVNETESQTHSSQIEDKITTAH